MNTTLIIVLLVSFLLIMLVLVFLYFHQRKEASELKQKMSFSLQGEEPMRLEYQGSGIMEELTAQFNQLVDANRKLGQQVGELQKVKSEGSKMEAMVKSVETTLNHVKLINDIGKDITSQLELEDVLQQFAKVVLSTVRVSELHWVFAEKDQVLRHYMLSRDEKVNEEESGQWLTSDNNILTWAYRNGREVFLKNAVDDFARYVFHPPVMFQGKVAQSILCIPFSYQQKLSGAIGIFSDRKDEFDQYHLDFIASLATYLAAAMENAFLYADLKKEKSRSEDLLLNILPASVADELKRSGTSKPRYHEMVTVMFTDFADFTRIAERMESNELVREMDQLFSAYDAIMEKHGIEKIKTIGDAYMCVSGLNNESGHAHQMALAAFDIIRYMEDYKGQRIKEGRPYFEIRVGIHSGSVVSGVVGRLKFAFDIWGDTVNLASRMESSGVAGYINISGTTHALISGAFDCEYRGKVAAKGKGELDMYFIRGAKSKAK